MNGREALPVARVRAGCCEKMIAVLQLLQSMTTGPCRPKNNLDGCDNVLSALQPAQGFFFACVP
jgi:hypothetical protein